MNNNWDIITPMPPEASSKIFSFLDARSLLACSRVSEGWDDITRYLPSEIWHDVCTEADIFVESDKYDNAADWKRFLSSMMQRKDDMKTSACFSVDNFRLRDQLTALYCHNGRIALAYLDRIEIRSLPECEILQTLTVNFGISYLKFDDSFLLAGSRNGIIKSWSARTGLILGDYSHFREIPTCFDFLTDYDMFVKSFFDNKLFVTGINMYSMSNRGLFTGFLLEDQSLIVKVMLVPHPDKPITDEQKTCLMFCLTMDYVDVIEVTLRPTSISFQNVACHNFDDIPLHPDGTNDYISKPTGGLRFDGENLYVMVPSLPHAKCLILEWNLRQKDKAYKICGNKITSLLGVGEMYLAYEVKTGENSHSVHISHKDTDEVVATINIPGRRWFFDDYLCLAKTSWLDGLDGENDSGIVIAAIADDLANIEFIKFVPRRER